MSILLKLRLKKWKLENRLCSLCKLYIDRVGVRIKVTLFNFSFNCRYTTERWWPGNLFRLNVREIF